MISLLKALRYYLKLSELSNANFLFPEPNDGVGANFESESLERAGRKDRGSKLDFSTTSSLSLEEP